MTIYLLFNTPISDSVKIFKKDFVTTKMILESKGIKIDTTTTIKDVANKMKTLPFLVSKIITQYTIIIYAKRSKKPKNTNRRR